MVETERKLVRRCRLHSTGYVQYAAFLRKMILGCGRSFRTLVKPKSFKLKREKCISEQAHGDVAWKTLKRKQKYGDSPVFHAS